ncbi:hypothetical protein [Streptomyces corynorhini]|uniref:DUF5129 domain-containing protein n=1 Tax=Streptomyces corynorhini TaxID=2282652 RepID=A0A370AWD6_9ACTN|nr:hypothetical protein [Streptomyces corynorhini]RDG33967.1 hypothetical protein DVH02_30885 [Streptomyces corynorhini]
MPLTTGARPRRRSLLALVTLLLAGAAALLAPGTAYAASGPAEVAEALKKGPVYVDPRAAGQLPKADAEALAKKITDADKPVFVAVLPAADEFPRATVISDVRTLTGVTGVYAVRLGDAFSAGSDPQVMSRGAVDNLRGAVRRSSPDDATAQLDGFVDQALQQAKGSAPASWADGADDEEGSGGSGALILGAVVVAGGAGAYVLYRRGKRQREERERAELAALRTVVDEDITAFGEELDRLGFSPSEPGADDAMRQDYGQVLDAYETARTQVAAATRPDEIRPVVETLEQGRFALASLAARRAGDPPPERRVPCFFDPRHGPSVSDVLWAPPGGTDRAVPACATDAELTARGGTPRSRMVDTAQGPQPYWNAGPGYAPWAGGYFGVAAGAVGGLLMGTMIGSMLSAPSAFADSGAGLGESLPEGGDVSGADFDTADFGGGFGGFGGGSGDSGGDFGGGDW